MTSFIRIATVTLVIVNSFYVTPGKCDFETPFLEEVDPPHEDVDVNPVTNNIQVPENLWNQRLVKIRVTDMSVAPTFTTEGPAASISRIEQDPETQEFYLIFDDPGLDFEDPLYPAGGYFFTLNHQGGPERYVTLRVKDINDNRVIITEMGDLVQEIPELTDPSLQPITFIRGEDADEMDRDLLHYSLQHIIGGDDSVDPLFEIDEKTGDVFLRGQLNYSQSYMHRLSLMVQDSDDIHNDTIIVTVNVRDAPNLPPVFQRVPTSITVDESMPIGSNVGRVVAQDGDLGLAWSMSYSLTEEHKDPVNTPQMFSIDEITGEITVISEIDAEALYFYEGEDLTFTITVKATEVIPEGYDEYELEPLSDEAEITITIRDLNDNPPEICIVQTPTFESSPAECGSSQTYSVSLEENYVGVVPLNLPFVIRDQDPTNSYSRYEVAFDQDTTPELISNAFLIQPPSSSSITEYTIIVRDTSALDYELEVDDGEGNLIGFWWENDETGNPVPKEHTVTIIARGYENPSHLATAIISLKLTDLNDNAPVFESTSYRIPVCEQMQDLTPLRIRQEDTTSPICRNWPETDELIRITATDKDISPDYRVISYLWDENNSRLPPVRLEPSEGGVTMILDMTSGNEEFDYERVRQEYFTLVARDADSNSLANMVTVTFAILDVNDDPVDLRVPSSSNVVEEGGEPRPGFRVVSDIRATDKDVSPEIIVAIDWNQSSKWLMSQSDNRTVLSKVPFQENDIIQSWFELQLVDTTAFPNELVYAIVLTDTVIDREHYDNRDIERVDLVLVAHDSNTEHTDDGSVQQTLVIRITDINDNPPVWDDMTIIDGEVTAQIQETEEWEGEDPASPSQREIFTFRVTDRDLSSDTRFWWEAKGCLSNCEEYINLVELDNPSTGKAILYRKQGVGIDREATKFYNDTTDFLNYVVWVTDGVHNISVDLNIAIEDINDNAPEWTSDIPTGPILISELAVNDTEVAQFTATDRDRPDRYGKVSYILPDRYEDNDNFRIDQDTGVVTVRGRFFWDVKSRYTLYIEAIDNYRTETSPGSNRISTTLNVTIDDENDNPPEFLSPTPTLGELLETQPVAGQPLEEIRIRLRDIDDPSKGNGNFTVTVVGVTRDDSEFDELPFSTGQHILDNGDILVELVPLISFVGLWGNYEIIFEAKDHGTPDPLNSTRTYPLRILDENLNNPEFEYPSPDNSTIEIIPLSHQLGPLSNYDNAPIRCLATDADEPNTDNSRVNYRVRPNPDDINDGSVFFGIQPNGRMTLTQQLPENASTYRVVVEAHDHGIPQPRSAFIYITFRIRPDINREPFFENHLVPEYISIEENGVGIGEEVEAATDNDPDDTIHYHIVGGSTREFFAILESTDSSNPNPKVITAQALDRETIKEHRIVIFASNNVDPPGQIVDPDQPEFPSTSYRLVIIEVENLFDEPPTFPQAGIGRVITGGFSTRNIEGEIITTIIAHDPDDFDYLNFRITSEFNASDPSLPTNPFRLERRTEGNLTVDLIINFTPRDNINGYYTFDLTATDIGDISTTVQCKIYMVRDIHVVQFTFLNRLDDVEAVRDNLADALSTAFGHRCNIDRLATGNNDDISTTQTYTHFIDFSVNEPIPASYIQEQQFNPEVYKRLSDGLASVGITLAQNGIGNPEGIDSGSSNLPLIISLVGLGLMAVVLLVVSTTCFFNNRSLTRRVRALTATTFGSQQSDLNRIVANDNLPNTNEFAIEGSNPIWTKPQQAETPRSVVAAMRQFDQESVGSGGSILIGVEDDDDFRGYKEYVNADTISSMNDEEDDAGYQNYHQNQPSRRGTFNPMFQEDGDEDDFYQPQQVDDSFGFDDSPFAFEGDGTVKRNNPLAGMNMADLQEDASQL